jgi:ribosome recycling factor
MDDLIKSHQEEFEKVIDFLKKDIQSLRTNRANPELVSHLLIEVYGTKTPLEQLATLSIPEPRSIVIQPWDKNILKEITQALVKSNLNINPNVSNGVIRLNFPPLNEETRNNLVKVLNEKLENARKSLRSVRDSVKEEIVKAEKEKEIGEDEKYRFFDNLDDLTNDYQEKIKEIGQIKEKEILTI